MRPISFVLLLITVLACTDKKAQEKTSSSPTITAADSDVKIIGEQPEPDTLKGSLKAAVTGTVGNASITINYHSPAVRGRVIWGGLVPYNQVWVTGAHRATNIEFNKDVEVGDTKLVAGKYALFTIPGADEWTIIINKNWNQHLTDNYNQKDDLVRVKAKPKTSTKNQERLRYVINSLNDNNGEVVVCWEKLEVSLTIVVQ
ncbi:MAG: DUF2911 domain-containing protein [Bacteroidetes bacterium]|nr:DUF2911 domain-containing protein [Bacteroidota bacterium]